MLRGLLVCSLPVLFAVTATAQESKSSSNDQSSSHEQSSSNEWWAYQPVVRPMVPAVEDAQWLRSPIDAFILAGLEAKGFRPAPPADRHELLRRVTYDLTGLPPTQDEIDTFLADTSATAYEQVVERLLASPQYGVKWAQHWLDLVRYAETDGYERDSVKPSVWRYRDWVVDALNADMPYGDFVTKQLAGDELPDAKVADHIATGYYRLGIWDDEPTDREQHLYDAYDGIADTTARATLAISMGCARCHDHKKDPLPHKDYHAFLGFFENITPYDKQSREMARDGEQAKFEQQLRDYRNRAATLKTHLLRIALLHRVTAVAVGSAKEIEPDLVAAWSSHSMSATQLLDQIAEHHGKIHGQIVEVPTGEGGGYRFDGDDYAVIPRVVEQSFTVTLRLRTKDRGPGRSGDNRWFSGAGLVDGEVSGIVDDWGIAWHADGVVNAGVGNPDTFLSSPPGLNDGEWHDVAFTRDMATGRIALYVDGQMAGEAVASTRPLTSPEDLVIGRARPGGAGYRGDLDDIKIYGRALSATEVVALAVRAPGGLSTAPMLEQYANEQLQELLALRAPTLRTLEVLGVREHGRNAPAAIVRLRGNVHNRGPQVDIGVPGMLGASAVLPEVAPAAASSGRRLALAKWLTSAGNQLTWRVIANRLWQHHFGRGIVRSSNDFGRLGSLPTHPELLDWLACEVLARDQSLKAMHRLMVTSATYRMSTQASQKELAQDPLNDSFWRFDRRRLTAEEVRDSILTVNGTINLKLAGPSVYPPLPQAVLLTASRPEDAWGDATPEQAARRSLYVHVKRSLPEPLLAAFDRADTDASCPVRFATVQPTQALSMINGDFANRQAQQFAERLVRERSDLASRLGYALELVSQCPPREADQKRLLDLANELQRDFARTELEALQRCCLVLLNCNEFLFLD